MDDASLEENDDMLLDACLKEQSSQESLTGRFDDLFASHDELYCDANEPPKEISTSIDNGPIIGVRFDPQASSKAKLDVHSTILPRSSEQSSQLRRDRYWCFN